jgi:hypothetical protein
LHFENLNDICMKLYKEFITNIHNAVSKTAWCSPTSSTKGWEALNMKRIKKPNCATDILKMTKFNSCYTCKRKTS